MESAEDAAQPEPVPAQWLNPADVELTSAPKAAAPTATELVDRCSAAAPCPSAAAPSAAVPGSLSAAPSASACRPAPPPPPAPMVKPMPPLRRKTSWLSPLLGLVATGLGGRGRKGAAQRWGVNGVGQENGMVRPLGRTGSGGRVREWATQRWRSGWRGGGGEEKGGVWVDPVGSGALGASTELWRIIEEGYSPRDPKNLTRREVVDDQLNATAINMIHMAVTPKDRAHIRSLKTAKEAWNKLDKLFLRNESIQSSR
ncbi:hypothetical protein QYE76_067431 [Lolium multiflorum]|uniref:Uncharacterized protein n=1 Tax=Lolium multiflorum TaxID=4521 RepID=A0AAD8SCD8_LOLMU|nr:hypothetical protein QYE76_067431 [Lolium multiflorum]